MNKTDNSLTKLENTLNYHFNDKNLLVQALKHSSKVRNKVTSNERLEFLGDRVLGLVVADILYHRFPCALEGDLGYRFTSLVKTNSLARIAEHLQLANYIKLSQSALNSSNQTRKNILSDTCEAILAAIYLDGGFKEIYKFIKANWDTLINENIEPYKDAKTELQEWAQKNKYSIPSYSLIDQSGPDHHPQFIVEVQIDNSNFPPCSASGTSKKETETLAAAIFLNQIKASID